MSFKSPLIIINLHKHWPLLLLIIIALTGLNTTKAYAEPKGVDFFAVNSARPTSPPSNNSNKTPWATDSEHTPIAVWFEQMDTLREKYHPTEGDKVILTRPLMQQAERVQQWTNTANKVSKNYLLLAKSIRTLTVPTGMPDVKEYQTLVADWYQDAAQVYQELIRPRPPAHTIEDLQEQLDAVKKRSESLGNNIANLKTMDRALRQQYKVHPAIQDDALQQFVRSK